MSEDKTAEQIANEISDKYLDTDTFSVSLNAALWGDVKRIIEHERQAKAELQRKLDVCREALEWEKHRCGDLQGPLREALNEIRAKEGDEG